MYVSEKPAASIFLVEKIAPSSLQRVHISWVHNGVPLANSVTLTVIPEDFVLCMTCSGKPQLLETLFGRNTAYSPLLLAMTVINVL
jgi:hypothetical protein